MPGYLDQIKQMYPSDTDQRVVDLGSALRHTDYEINEFNEIRSALLSRLRTGQVWLTNQHRRWQASDTTAADNAEFSRVWNGWWELDRRLRADHGFQSCINKPNGICPEGFPCQGCVDVPVPSVVARLELAEVGE